MFVRIDYALNLIIRALDELCNFAIAKFIYLFREIAEKLSIF